MNRSAPRSIDQYLRQLREDLAGEDPALIQDALYDAEEYLRAEVAAHPEKAEADILEIIASTYGAPDEVAAAYRDTEIKVKAAMTTPVHTGRILVPGCRHVDGPANLVDAALSVLDVAVGNRVLRHRRRRALDQYLADLLAARRRGSATGISSWSRSRARARQPAVAGHNLGAALPVRCRRAAAHPVDARLSRDGAIACTVREGTIGGASVAGPWRDAAGSRDFGWSISRLWLRRRRELAASSHSSK